MRMKEGRENGQVVKDREKRRGERTVAREEQEKERTRKRYLHAHEPSQRACNITLSRTSLSSAMC